MSEIDLEDTRKNGSEIEFNVPKLKKLHLQLKHGTLTGMKDYLQSADFWDTEYEESIKNIIMECGCGNAASATPHTVVSTKTPARQKQSYLAVDLIFLYGTPCLHVMDRCAGWSETGVL